jgi:hypothetical protein
MRTVPCCLSIGLIVICSAAGLAAESESKEESAEAAERILLAMREKAGDLQRFEAEFYYLEVDHLCGTEKRGRGHVYFESPCDAQFEVRTIDISHMQSRQYPNGRSYSLEKIRPLTWLWQNGTCTEIDEPFHTYTIYKLKPKGDCFVGWFSYIQLASAPRLSVPLWLDPEVEWEYLKSQYKFVDAKSTPLEFAVRLVRRDSDRRPDWCDGSRFEWDYRIVLDRRTCLPKRYTILQTSATLEQTYIYGRFDINPPHRELRVDLTGYVDARTLPSQSTSNDKGSDPIGATLLVCLQFLAWYLF